MELRSGYLSPVFDLQQRKKTLRAAKKALAGMDFDVIVVRGVSGLLIGAPLAIALNKPLCVVRKEDGSHSNEQVEGYVPEAGDRWLIVDDLVDSGDTLDAIKRYIGSRSTFLGAWLFRYHPRVKNPGEWLSPRAIAEKTWPEKEYDTW